MPTTNDEPSISHEQDKTLVVEANGLASAGQFVTITDHRANPGVPSEYNGTCAASVNNAVAPRTERLT